jgi:hypothetical protein
VQHVVQEALKENDAKNEADSAVASMQAYLKGLSLGFKSKAAEMEQKIRELELETEEEIFRKAKNLPIGVRIGDKIGDPLGKLINSKVINSYCRR